MWKRENDQDVGEIGSFGAVFVCCAGGFSFCFGLSGSSGASAIVAQYFLRTCFNAGLLMGLGRKKSMPESRHSLTLLSSENAVNATIGAEKPIPLMSRVLSRPSTLGI